MSATASTFFTTDRFFTHFTEARERKELPLVNVNNQKNTAQPRKRVRLLMPMPSIGDQRVFCGK